MDCLIVGHNQFDMVKQRKFLRLNYGKDSNEYRETNTSNLGFIKYNNNLYSPSQMYNILYNNVSPENEEYSYVSNMVEESFGLAVAYLGSYLNKMGFSIDYINSFRIEKNDLIKKLEKNDIDCIIIPTTYYLKPYPIIEIVSLVRKYSSNIKIIVGGPYILYQARTLKDHDLQKLFSAIGADIYIYNNEGEYALGCVVNAIKKNLPYEGIDNIFYKKDGRYILTSYVQEGNQLDENPVKWELFNDRISKFVNVRTSISCPFSCAFCAYPLYAGRYQAASIQAIENELNLIDSSGKVLGVFFTDDTFNFPEERFKEILKILLRNKYKFKWAAHLRGQFVNRETIEQMKQSGCIQVLLGIESGNQQILNNMNKKTSVEKYREVIGLLNEYEIMSTASLIVGFPGETYQTYLDTVNFIEETRPTFFRTHMWHYQIGAPIDKRREEFNIQGSGFEWSHDTMDSKTAHELSDNIFTSIKNSIYDAECSFPFQLACKGYSYEKIKDFMKAFSMCIKDDIKNPSRKEDNNKLIEKLSNALI